MALMVLAIETKFAEWLNLYEESFTVKYLKKLNEFGRYMGKRESHKFNTFE